MRTETERDYQARILRVLIHIQLHLDNALCLDELARVATFSPYHFHRVFRGMVGETIMEHIRRLRLERAAQRLKFSDQSVTRIAFEAGYETHEAFTRAFRARFGNSPTGFRQASQPLLTISAPSNVHFAPDGRLNNFTPPVPGDTRMDARIERVEPMRVAFIRHTGPYQEVGPTWEKLCAWAGPRGLFGPDTMFIGLSYDDPEITAPDKIRYDACITVGPDVEGEGEIGIQEVGNGDFAVTTHKGPYENLAQTYGTLCGQWIPASGRTLRACPCMEIYRNSPQDTAPEALITDVFVPVE